MLRNSCLLFAVCGLPFVVSCLLYGICCLLFDVLLCGMFGVVAVCRLLFLFVVC